MTGGKKIIDGLHDAIACAQGDTTAGRESQYCPACGREFSHLWAITTGGPPLCQQPHSPGVIFPGCLLKRPETTP